MNVKKYRKKLVEIEAIQFTSQGENLGRVFSFIKGEEFKGQDIFISTKSFIVYTPENKEISISLGDWVVKEYGEIKVYTNDDFKNRYEECE